MRDGPILVEGHPDQVLAGVLGGLLDGGRDLASLAETVPDEAENEKRRPPFTTAADRLILTRTSLMFSTSMASAVSRYLNLAFMCYAPL